MKKTTLILIALVTTLCFVRCTSGTTTSSTTTPDSPIVNHPAPDTGHAEVNAAQKSNKIAGNEFFKQLVQNEDQNCEETAVQQNEDIYQYAFSLKGLPKIADGDDWYLHKAWDGNNVCFVLVIKNSGKAPPQYYKGNVRCPKVCGLKEDLSLQPCLKDYLNKKPITQIDEATAQKLMQKQVPGLIYSLMISWGVTLKFIQKHTDAGYCVLLYADPVTHERPSSGEAASVLIPYDTNGNSYDSDNGGTCFYLSDSLCLSSAAAPCAL